MNSKSAGTAILYGTGHLPKAISMMLSSLEDGYAFVTSDQRHHFGSVTRMGDQVVHCSRPESGSAAVSSLLDLDHLQTGAKEIVSKCPK